MHHFWEENSIFHEDGIKRLVLAPCCDPAWFETDVE